MMGPSNSGKRVLRRSCRCLQCDWCVLVRQAARRRRPAAAAKEIMEQVDKRRFDRRNGSSTAAYSYSVQARGSVISMYSYDLSGNRKNNTRCVPPRRTLRADHAVHPISHTIGICHKTSSKNLTPHLTHYCSHSRDSVVTRLESTHYCIVLSIDPHATQADVPFCHVLPLLLGSEISMGFCPAIISGAAFTGPPAGDFRSPLAGPQCGYIP